MFYTQQELFDLFRYSKKKERDVLKLSPIKKRKKSINKERNKNIWVRSWCLSPCFLFIYLKKFLNKLESIERLFLIKLFSISVM